jgi:hypothetical protein
VLARRRALAGVLIAGGIALLVLLLVVRFWPGGSGPSVRGIITAVEARDIGHATAITLQDREGMLHQIQVSEIADPQWTPAHLREHMTFGQPVTVYYRREGDALVAIRITD